MKPLVMMPFVAVITLLKMAAPAKVAVPDTVREDKLPLPLPSGAEPGVGLEGLASFLHPAGRFLEVYGAQVQVSCVRICAGDREFVGC